MENGCISKGGITLNKNIRGIVWRGVLVYCLVFWGVVVAAILHVAGM